MNAQQTVGGGEIMQEAKCEYKNWSRKIWVEAYLLSYNQFKLDEARRG